MKYYGNHICGHEGKIDVRGPESTRDYKVRRFFNSLCKECSAIKKNEEGGKRREELIAFSKDLPPLKGSEKQVKWALDIRHELYTYFLGIDFSKLKDRGKITVEGLRKTCMFVFNQDKAIFFIDNRSLSLRDYMEKFYDEVNIRLGFLYTKKSNLN